MTQNSWVGGDAVCDHALSLALGRALEKAPDFVAGKPGAIALIVSEMPPSAYIPALGICLFEEQEDDRPSLLAVFDDERPKNLINRYRTHCLTSKRSVIVARQEADLPQPVRLAVDHVIKVEPMSAADLQQACKSMLGAKVTEKQAIEALSYPREHLWDALRKGRNFNQVLARLREVCLAESPRPVLQSPGLPKLEQLHGYGAAKDWGMRLTRDLDDWRAGKIAWADVDRGVLLVGPPGTGKTLFAGALARQCEANFVATSIGQWQARGHLGDMLQAMREDFKRAAQKAPSVLLIDELDSVGDRAKFTGRNAGYETQVVNALLECLDGTTGREGVIVVGATNRATEIDPAILRPGRLETIVAISLPDEADRLKIIDQLVGKLPDDTDRNLLERATAGMSGADLEKMCRDARRAARTERRAVQFVDLTRCMPPTLRISDTYKRRASIHEAGHAIVGCRLECGTFHGVFIADTVRSDSAQAIGTAIFKLHPVACNNQRSYLAMICMLLAGIAAEQLLLGNYADGAGITKGSDLDKATRLAALLEAQTGMGSRLRFSAAAGDEELYRLLVVDRDLAASVEKILAKQLARAKTLLQSQRTLLTRASDILVERGSLDAAEFEALAGEQNDVESRQVVGG